MSQVGVIRYEHTVSRAAFSVGPAPGYPLDFSLALSTIIQHLPSTGFKRQKSSLAFCLRMVYNSDRGGRAMKDYRNLQWTFSSASSGGTYLKAEQFSGGKKYYYKLSDFQNGRFTGCEAALEVIASRLGQYLGFPVLKYTGSMARIIIDGKEYQTFVVRSQNYVKSGFTVIPLITDYLTNRLSDMESPLAYCQRIGLQPYLDCVFLFDYLIMNIDRHGHNIELLYNTENQMQPAPIFDNGRSLTCSCGNNTVLIQNWDYRANEPVNNFVGSIYPQQNLKHISRIYTLPKLTEDVFAMLFRGLGSMISSEHQNTITEAISWRYAKLLEMGYIQ